MPDPLPFDRPLQWPAEWAFTAEPPPGHGTPSDRAWGLLSHLIVLPVVLPLAVVLAVGERSPYVLHQAQEALNFQITVVLAVLACSLLAVVLVGLLLLPLVVGGALALSVRASRAASRGAWHRYPWTLRLLR